MTAPSTTEAMDAADATASAHYDIVVVGAGPAGERAAVQAAHMGKRVCLVERAPKPGGAAVHTGLLPAKVLRESALAFLRLRQRDLRGIDIAVRRDITLADFMARERPLAEGEWARIGESLRRHGVELAQGTARFLDARTIELSRFREAPRRLTADVVLLATGAVPLRPDDVPFDGRHVVDSESLLRLPAIPRSLLVVGGGAVGCEYACTLAALGVPVTLVNARDRLLTTLDAEASHALERQMTARLAITVLNRATPERVEVAHEEARVTLSSGAVLSADVVLHCAGRTGDIAALDLAAAGVRVCPRGFVEVDEQGRTSAPWIYAAGDVTGAPPLASAAAEQARAAVLHAFELRDHQRLARVVPYGVWTIPEVAMAGETEESARAKGLDHEVGRAPLRANLRAEIAGEADGLVKLVFRPGDQRLLGVSCVGDGANELVHLGAACLATGGTIDAFAQMIVATPSLAEAYRDAAQDGLQRLARHIAARTGLPSAGR